jgi:hypothetical protein
MKRGDLSALFAGSDDESLLLALYGRIHNPGDEIQRTFCLAWEAFELVHSDGFEMLIGQGRPMEHYSTALAKIGVPQAGPIFSRVLALIPPDLLLPQNEEALGGFLHGRFEELKELAYQLIDACRDADFVSLAGRYVRQHRKAFYQYAAGSATEGEPDDG